MCIENASLFFFNNMAPIMVCVLSNIIAVVFPCMLHILFRSLTQLLIFSFEEGLTC